MSKSACPIQETHCESCGSTSPEDVRDLADTGGYSRCCNELTATHRDCRNQHGQEQAFQKGLDEAVAAAGFAGRGEMISEAGQAAFDALADKVAGRVYR